MIYNKTENVIAGVADSGANMLAAISMGVWCFSRFLARY